MRTFLFLMVVLSLSSCSIFRDDTLFEPFYDVREVGTQLYFVSSLDQAPEILEAIHAYAKVHELNEEDISTMVFVVGGELYVTPQALEFFLNYRK